MCEELGSKRTLWILLKVKGVIDVQMLMVLEPQSEAKIQRVEAGSSTPIIAYFRISRRLI